MGIAGKSQGAVMSATMALRGTSKLLAGAFVVAGYPPRPLYTDEDGSKGAPSSWPSSDVENKKSTKMYFYTGDRDSATHRQVLLPIQQRCEEVGPESRQLPLLEQDRLHPRADQSSWQRVPRPVARGAGRSGPSRRGGRGGARQRLQALGPSFFC